MNVALERLALEASQQALHPPDGGHGGGSQPQEEHEGRAGRWKSSCTGRVAPGPLARPLAQAGLGAMLHRQVVEEPPQVLGQVACAGVSAVGVEVEALVDQGVEAPGDFGTSCPERRGRAAVLDHLLDRLERRRPRLRRGQRKGCSPAIISKRIRPSA